MIKQRSFDVDERFVLLNEEIKWRKKMMTYTSSSSLHPVNMKRDNKKNKHLIKYVEVTSIHAQ